MYICTYDDDDFEDDDGDDDDDGDEKDDDEDVCLPEWGIWTLGWRNDPCMEMTHKSWLD